MSQTDEDFAALFAQSQSTSNTRLRPGQSVQGIVVQISKDTVFVDVGARSEGRIERRQLSNDEGEIQVAVGDTVRATVASGGDRPRLVVGFGRGSQLDIESLQLALEAGTPVEGTVSKAVKGGLEVELSGKRAFCPASHVDLGYVPELEVYEGQSMSFKILEIKEGGRSVLLSRKALLADERRAQSAETLASLQPGSVMEGTIKSLQSYGAFVDIGGIEGLIHISELGHGRVGSVEEVVSAGETVRVQVLSVEQGEGDRAPRVRLSMKALQSAGEAGVRESRGAPVEILEAKVVKVEPFGVFVSTEKGPAVIPTRELALAPGSDPRRAYPAGKELRAVSIGNDSSGRARLSEKRVEEAEAKLNFRAFRQEEQSRSAKGGSMGSFGSLLKAHLNE